MPAQGIDKADAFDIDLKNVVPDRLFARHRLDQGAPTQAMDPAPEWGLAVAPVDGAGQFRYDNNDYGL